VDETPAWRLCGELCAEGYEPNPSGPVICDPCQAGLVGNCCTEECVATTTSTTTTTAQADSCLYQCDGGNETWNLVSTNCDPENECEAPISVCDELNDGELLWITCS
jgi:hypothetical protein